MHILKNQYTYYHYHWLWGMQYTPQAPSYYIKQQMEDYLLYPQQLIQHIDQIKKIQEEITKVGTEIDSIKKEIMLLTDYSIN